MTVEHLAIACHLGDIAESGDRHVFVAPFPCLIASARLVATAGIPESAEFGWEIGLLRRRSGVETPIVTKTTARETGQEILPDTEWSFDVSPWDAEARQLPTGGVVSMRFRRHGTPPPITGVLVVLRYEPT